MDMRRALEIASPALAVVTLALAAYVTRDIDIIVVLAFGALVVLAENTSVLVHTGADVSPTFMIVMASIATMGDDSALVGAPLVGACGGLILPHIRQQRWGILGFNCGQYVLASLGAAVAYLAFGEVSGYMHVVAAVAAAFGFGAVNISFVLPHVALKLDERIDAVWADMYPALPNYVAWGLLGLLVGLVCQELGALAILLLTVPMAIGRWTFRSFNRVKESHDASVQLFIRLIEAKDPYTAGHTERVAKYSAYIGEEMGLPAARIDHLRASALMHDVGKLAVPSKLLNKPGKLTPEEWDVVRRHNDAGIDILGRITFMRTMAVTASDKHGHYDKSSGEAPPPLVLEAHIVAVADAFDAMTSTRAYRKALSQAVAYEELRKNSGTQFNPRCVDALIGALDRRGEQYGAGFEVDAHEFAVPPPEAGVGSAGLGDLEVEAK
jgi:hypothetical protein